MEPAGLSELLYLLPEDKIGMRRSGEAQSRGEVDWTL